MSALPVTFFYPYPDEVERIDFIDPSTHTFWTQHANSSRRRGWILRTYLRLRAAGHKIALSTTLPDKGAVVVLVEDNILQHFLDQFRPSHRRLFIVTIRADIIGYRSPLADIDIVQNGCFADETRTFFIPYWPQPGLVPRDPDRDNQIRTIAFKGGSGSLRDSFRSDEWHTFLQAHDLTFNLDTPANPPLRWHDYSSVDLLLAVRPQFRDGKLRPEKPATKLYNAWHARTPAILGPEYAFRELRESPLDYIEVNSLAEAMESVHFLLNHPEHYRAMIEQGSERAQHFTEERITERWAEVLFEHVPRIVAHRGAHWTRSLPLPLRRMYHWVTHPPTPFELRKQLGHLCRKMSGK